MALDMGQRSSSCFLLPLAVLVTCLTVVKASWRLDWDVAAAYPSFQGSLEEKLTRRAGEFQPRNLLQLAPDEALLKAAVNGDIKAARRALKDGADIETMDTETGSTPLVVAIENGHTKVASMLLKHGANTEAARSSDGATALIVAALLGNSEIGKELIKNSAVVDAARTLDGGTPLILASMKLGHPSELMVSDLLDAGANMSFTNLEGLTPLHSSAYWGNVGTLELLLLEGADTRLEDNDGNTPVKVICDCSKHAEELQQCDKGGCEQPRVVQRIEKLLTVFNETIVEAGEIRAQDPKQEDCGGSATAQDAIECLLEGKR